MPTSYLVLAFAVAFEVTWPVLLKLSNGFSVLWASVAMAVAYMGSLFCLNIACRGLAVSLAYPIWAGFGGTLTLVIGVVAFKEPLGLGRAVGVAFVILGVALMLGFRVPTAEGG